MQLLAAAQLAGEPSLAAHDGGFKLTSNTVRDLTT